jgi:hypothetical protein
MSDADDFQKLRRETIKMLGFDETKLSGLEGMQCDLCATLLLEIDNMQALSVAGQQVDLNRLADAVKILKSLLPSAPLSAQQPDFSGAKDQLVGLLQQRSFGLGQREKRLSETLQAEIATLQTENERLRAGVTPQALLQRQETPAPTPQAPPQTSNQPPLPKPSNSPPAHYLKKDDGPWRKHVNADGSISPGSASGGKYWGPVGERR